MIEIMRSSFKTINSFLSKDKTKFTIYPDDTFLVSYPKSGSTWLRFLVSNYISNNSCDFHDRKNFVPDIYTQNNWNEIKRPRYIKTHQPFTKDYKKVVYLVRDGRSVAVSYYFHCLKFRQIEPEVTFQDYLTKFNTGSLDNYSQWNNHVLSWLEKPPQNFILVRYEDLKKDTAKELSRLLSFLNISVAEKKVKEAIEASKLSKMKAIWRDNQDTYPVLANSDKSIPFIRNGKTDEWKDFFDSRTISDFLEVNEEALKKLKYI